jgi:hypothetical protein
MSGRGDGDNRVRRGDAERNAGDDALFDFAGPLDTPDFTASILDHVEARRGFSAAAQRRRVRRYRSLAIAAGVAMLGGAAFVHRAAPGMFELRTAKPGVSDLATAVEQDGRAIARELRIVAAAAAPTSDAVTDSDRRFPSSATETTGTVRTVASHAAADADGVIKATLRFGTREPESTLLCSNHVDPTLIEGVEIAATDDGSRTTIEAIMLTGGAAIASGAGLAPVSGFVPTGFVAGGFVATGIERAASTSDASARDAGRVSGFASYPGGPAVTVSGSSPAPTVGAYTAGMVSPGRSASSLPFGFYAGSSPTLRELYEAVGAAPRVDLRAVLDGAVSADLDR